MAARHPSIASKAAKAAKAAAPGPHKAHSRNRSRSRSTATSPATRTEPQAGQHDRPACTAGSGAAVIHEIECECVPLIGRVVLARHFHP